MKHAWISLVMLIAMPLPAQQPSPANDRYKVHLPSAAIFSAPDPQSSKIGEIAGDIVITPIAKQSYWIKVTYEGKTGWLNASQCDRLMETPAPDLDIVLTGYKLVNGEYRYFFIVSNIGVKPYIGDLTIHLYADNEIPLRGVESPRWRVPHSYLPTDAGPHGYPVNTGDFVEPRDFRFYGFVADRLATRYVFETVQGKREGEIDATKLLKN